MPAVALDAELLPRKTCARFGESGVQVAGAERHRADDVVVPGVVERVGHRGRAPARRSRTGGQRLVVDGDEFGGVLGLVAALGRQRRDLGSPTYSTFSVASRWHSVKALAGDARVDGQGACEPLDFSAVQGVEHAGRAARRGHVDAPQVGVGLDAPHHGQVDHAGQRDVADEAPAPREQPRVFDAPHARADVFPRRPQW